MKKFIGFLAFIIIVYLLPESAVIPVKNATTKDWNHYSYWFHPWGKSSVHKGIDIFAKQGTPVIAVVSGLVIFTGNIDIGGNVVVILGPKWRIHYFAHLSQVNTHLFACIGKGEPIGKVGNTGNALGKPPHLHYSILSLVPNPAEITTETQGWKRMFYVNPNAVLL
ncbi:MAG: M23 family metallopeptidase [Methylophilaceae bacterium]